MMLAHPVQTANSTPTQSNNSSTTIVIAIVVIATALCGIIIVYKKESLVSKNSFKANRTGTVK